MSNNMLTISDITNETLMVLDNEITFSRNVSREYDDRFGIAGAKIGAIANVRKPARFRGTTGAALNVEDFSETYMPVALSTQFHVDTQFTTADLLTSLDDFSGRVIKPAVATIANKVDYDGTTMAWKNTANTVGTPGTPPTASTNFLTAGALLDAEGVSRDGQRVVVLDPWTQASVVGGLQGLFNPQMNIGEMYAKGLMGRNTLGFDWYMDQNIGTFTVGAQGGVPVFSTAGTSSALLTSGWSDTGTLYTTGWSNSTNVLNVGDVISIANVIGVNPQNRATWGNNRARQYVVVPATGTPSAGTYNSTTGAYTSSGAGALQLTIACCVISGGQFQNVNVAPTNGASITVLGTANAISPQSIAMHKNAFTLAMADLELPDGVHFAGRASDKKVGMSIRIVRQYTINNDAIPARFDVLYGWAPLYREMAVRIAG